MQKKAEIAEIIEITSNGTLLNKEINSNIANAGMDIFNISINGINAEQYKEHCGITIDYDEFINNIRDLYEHKGNCQIYIKLSDTGYTKDEINEFYRIFGDICDQIYVENISSELWQGTNVNKKISTKHKGLYGEEIYNKNICTTIFTTMVINSKGDVKLCCADWKNEMIMGNVMENTIDEIWVGHIRKMQKLMLEKGRGNIPVCKFCIQPEISCPDNIDDYVDDIIKKYKNE